MEEHADAVVSEEMMRRRWDEEELERQAKGGKQKEAMEVRLRVEVAVTVKWLAARLYMGVSGYFNHLLCHRRMEKEE